MELELELELESETRHGKKEAQSQERFKEYWGKTPKAGKSMMAGGEWQGRIARKDWKGHLGSFLKGSKSRAGELDSILPVDYWKFLSKGVIVESLVWREIDKVQGRSQP